MAARAARLHRIAHHFAMRADDAANSCDRLAFELFEVARLFADRADKLAKVTE